MYATKRRRRNVRPHTKPSLKDVPQKSNPSKRHRERLNSELEMLASLLPFEQNIITKLDKLSILRLAVSYLRTKSYFHAALNDPYSPPADNHLHRRLHHRIVHGHHIYSDVNCTDSESVLQALSGFLFVVTCDGEVFFASHTVEQYLGFHQSDIIHQSALELIHSEDREHFKFQLSWRQTLSGEGHDLPLEQAILPENVHLLQRCFRVRFRCLLDNASGFITLEITGKIRPLLGQNCKSSTNLDSQLALFALCCPFGPLPLSDMPPRDYTFKSKHKMDMSPLTMDPRGRLVFEFTDEELTQMGGYDLVHPDDLSYHAAAHLELIKTGSSGLIAYRLMTKDFKWVWLQTSSRVIYKNSKPDFILCIHRHLTEDEGMDLVKKRGSEFKLPYPIIDADPTDLTLTCHSDDSSQQHVNSSCGGNNTNSSSSGGNNGSNNGNAITTNGRKNSPKYKKSKGNSANGGLVSVQQATSSTVNVSGKKQRKLTAKAELFYSPNGANLANMFGLNALYTSNINCFGYNNNSSSSSNGNNHDGNHHGNSVSGSGGTGGYNYNSRHHHHHFYDARIFSAAATNNDHFYHHKSSQYSIKPDSLGQSSSSSSSSPYAAQAAFDPAILYRGYQTFYSSFQVAAPMNEMALRHHYGRYYDFHQLQPQQQDLSSSSSSSNTNNNTSSSNNNSGNYYSDFQRNNHNFYNSQHSEHQQHLSNDCCANYSNNESHNNNSNSNNNNDEEFNNSSSNNNNGPNSPSTVASGVVSRDASDYYEQERFAEGTFISRHVTSRYSDCEKEKSCSPREVSSSSCSRMSRNSIEHEGRHNPHHNPHHPPNHHPPNHHHPNHHHHNHHQQHHQHHQKMLKSYFDWGAIDDILPSCLYANSRPTAATEDADYSDHPFFYPHGQTAVGYPVAASDSPPSSASPGKMNVPHRKNAPSDDNDENASPSLSPSCDDPREPPNGKAEVQQDQCWGPRHVSVVRHNSRSKSYSAEVREDPHNSHHNHQHSNHHEKTKNPGGVGDDLLVHGVATSVIQMSGRKSKQHETGRGQAAKIPDEPLDWSSWNDRRNKENDKMTELKDVASEEGLDKRLNLVDQQHALKIACFAAGPW